MSGRRRVFFALWPDSDTRRAFTDWQHMLRGYGLRPSHPQDLHLTLHFLGQVDKDKIRLLQGIGERLVLPGFQLHFDHLGVFPGPRVLWAGLDRAPEGLLHLHAALRSQLQRQGCQLEQRDYRPHLTLARKYTGEVPEITIAPVDWTVREWGLIESGSGRLPLYRPIALWDLA